MMDALDHPEVVWRRGEFVRFGEVAPTDTSHEVVYGWVVPQHPLCPHRAHHEAWRGWLEGRVPIEQVRALLPRALDRERQWGEDGRSLCWGYSLANRLTPRRT